VDINKEKAEEIVKDLVTKASNRFKQELAGENDEILDRVLRQFRAKVARYSWKASQKWCKWSDDGPVLMPDLTRIYYRKGGTEVLVQEFPPQVRLMKFKAGLATRTTTAEAITGSSDAIHQYSLALPYVVFLFKFVNGTFVDVRCAFNDRPLRKLEERPLRPYLSNLDTNLGVCLGPSFDRSQLQIGNITQQASYVLNHFWHSAYSDEWATHFWSTRAHFIANDARLASLSDWEEHSQENSLFVVEDVDWLKHQEESFGDMIVRMFEGDGENNNLQEELYTELIEKFFEDIKKTYNDTVSSVEERIAGPLAEQLTDELINQLQS
jgi:hypothetical protein